MNRRFIAPFLAVDVAAHASGSLAGGGYPAGARALSGDATGDFPAGMGPVRDAPLTGDGGADNSPEPGSPGCPPSQCAQRLS